MKIHFYHIQKTGGRSIICSFIAGAMNKKIETPKDVENIWDLYIQSNSKVLYLDKMTIFGHGGLNWVGDSSLVASHTPYKAIKFPTIDIFTITSIRNPIDRILSIYKESILEISGDYDKTLRCCHNGLQRLPEYKSKDIIEFCHKIPEQTVFGQTYFLNNDDKNPDNAIDILKKINHVLILENLKNDLNDLSQKINMDLPCVHVGMTTTDNSKYINESQYKELEKMLESEIYFYNKVKEYKGLI